MQDQLAAAIPATTTTPADMLHRALELHRAGDLRPAQAGYEAILAVQPRHADAINLLAAIAVQTGNPLKAVELYDKAIEIDPNNLDAYCNSAMALSQLRQLDEALARLEHVIAVKADFTEAYMNRGLILCELNRWEAALASYEQAVALEPDYAEAHLACGHVLQELNQLDAALARCDSAIALVDDYEDAFVGRGTLLHQLGRLDAARASYDRAIELKPDHATAYHGRSLTSLLLGDFENGWIDYEWRWKDVNCPLRGSMRDLPAPLWLGEEPIAGRTLLLHGEQGLGDTLHFCRYAKLVAEAGATVVLEVPEPLKELLRNLDGVSQVVVRGDPLPQFDYQCPLVSLPLAFKTRLDGVPASLYYLRSDATKVARWRARLGEKTRPRIGLVWSGSESHKNDRNRSIRLADLLQHLPEYHYVSLQKDVRDCDRQTLLSNPRLLRFSDDLQDFSDTAALCECMDVVISVDTAAAHLSAALGRTTWVLLPCVPDWRWLMHREDSPWYPSVRLFRQPVRGDWRTVMQRVRANLLQLQT